MHAPAYGPNTPTGSSSLPPLPLHQIPELQFEERNTIRAQQVPPPPSPSTGTTCTKYPSSSLRSTPRALTSGPAWMSWASPTHTRLQKQASRLLLEVVRCLGWGKV